jgi:fatty-acyl-CoA synthase
MFNNDNRLRGDRLDLRGMFMSSFAKHRERTAIVSDVGTFTYGAVDAAANQFAQFLSARGIGANDVVAVMLPNVPAFVVVDQAIIRARACKVAVNNMLSVEEQRNVLRVSGARIAVASGSQLEVARAVLAEGGVLDAVVEVDSTASPLGPWTDAAAELPGVVPAVGMTDGAIGRISFTGGTTGRPKAIRSSIDRIAINLVSHVIETELQVDDRLLLTTPLAHSAGLFMETALLVGAAVHLGAGFDARAVVDRIAREQITATFLVPTMLYRLLDAVEAEDTTLPLLRTVLYGAAPINRSRLEQALGLFGNVFIQFFGQTEAPNFITKLGRWDHSLAPGRIDRLASCGRAVTMTQVRVVGASGTDVPHGEVGEVVARTPYTMIDYMADAEATEHAFVDGWLKTGDLGWMDDEGFVFLVDRSKDMIITGGLNVYCREVEQFLGTVEGVADAAVFGLPDPDWGEQVVAAVVAEPGVSIDIARVLGECRRGLSKYKVPKLVKVVSRLPMTGVGKIDKKLLRVEWTEGSSDTRV